MAKMRWELEDLAFKHLEPEDYRALAKLVAQKRAERESLIAQLAEPLARELRAAGIRDVEVTGRPKHLWSIHKKMMKRDKPYEEIYDLLAIRVLVKTVPDCYHALGVIHDGWTPLQERIKDYIAQPKSNGYQSLHTTVFGPGRQLFEIQIRTRDMHRTAEFGIAAHWLYKDGTKSADELERHLLVVPAGARVAARRQDAGRIPGVPEARSLSGRDLRVHADGRCDPAAEGRDADRLRVRRAHGGRAALPGCQGSRARLRRSRGRSRTPRRSRS